jgi:hypothetical protein
MLIVAFAPQQTFQDWKVVFRIEVRARVLFEFCISDNILCQSSYLDNFSFKLYGSRGLEVFCKCSKAVAVRCSEAS